MSLQPNFEVLWIEQVLKNQVKPMLPSTLSTSLPSKDTKKASETAYSQIRCQRCFIFSLLNSPQPLISRGFPSFPTSSRMVSRQNVLFVIYSVKLHSVPVSSSAAAADMAPGVSGNVTSIPKIKSQLSDFLAAFCKIFLFLIFQSPPFSIFDHTPVCRIRSLTGLIHVPLPLFQIFVFFRTSISYIYSLIYTSCFRIFIRFSSV